MPVVSSPCRVQVIQPAHAAHRRKTVPVGPLLSVSRIVLQLNSRGPEMDRLMHTPGARGSDDAGGKQSL